MSIMRKLINLVEGAQREIDEAVPSDQMRQTRYFHGTDSQKAAEGIMAHGIIPNAIQKGSKRGQMAPVEGRAYITPDIHYAVMYAIGGNMLGTDLPAKWIEKDRYGYVFVINGADLADVQPDEDSVGEFVYDHSEIKREMGGWRCVYTPDGVDDDLKRRVWHNIVSALTDMQRKKICDGEYAYFASGGKRAVKKLSDQDKLLLIKWGAHVAHGGALQPVECWRIDKTRCPELAKDGSNFFEIAERIK